MKKTKNETPVQQGQCLPLHGKKFGTIALLITLSIAYSTILVVLTYLDKPKLLIGLAPQALFVAWLFGYKFISTK